MTDSKMTISRRQLLGAATALPLFSIASRPAFAAEFNYKFATGQDPSHPVNKRAQEAIDRIRNATNGRLDIKLFPPTSWARTPTCCRKCARAAWSSSTRPAWCCPPWCRQLASSTPALPSTTTTKSGKPWTARWAPMCVRRSRRWACSPCPSPGTTVSATSPPPPRPSKRRTTSRA